MNYFYHSPLTVKLSLRTRVWDTGTRIGLNLDALLHV